MKQIYNNISSIVLHIMRRRQTLGLPRSVRNAGSYGTKLAKFLNRLALGDDPRMNTHMDTYQLKITWKDLKSACEHAGIQDDDPLDAVHIAWGNINDLTCKKDDDFGWQIILE